MTPPAVQFTQVSRQFGDVKAVDQVSIDIKDGGTAIPYCDEDPFIREEYEAILKKTGVQSRMDASLYTDPTKRLEGGGP